ncbi:MAG: epoxyqueuosine reductase [Syntrophomonadaceae bacterium]|nr:epoxyqueuosine reductase [Syntrophomonadaceae bacterium]MDD3889035.1 epoxyqueuosine reductase [Syntrophomonadaceae bacterium]MDD4549250.1 epoxyqueuosine reductase [Syntrophomonadaceae bacterium]
MNIKNEIKQLIQNEFLSTGRNDLFRKPLVGFASADDPLFAQLKEIIGPEHVHPKDILPQAKTVVAFFIPFSETVVSSNRKLKEVSVEWAQAYLEANILINRVSEKLLQMLAEKGIKGEGIKATHTYDEETLKTSWSHRSAAFIAGLGRFGLNRMLITPIGGAGRYGSVIISEKIAPDHRSEEEFCIYFKEGKCQFCLNNCPTKALTINGFDKHKCHHHLLEVSKEFSYLGLCDVCGKCVVGPCAILSSK